MYKKRKILTQETPSSLKDALSLQYAPIARSSLSKVTDQNGNERQSAGSILVKPKIPYYLSMADLTSKIAPPFKIKITSYGVNTYNFSGQYNANYPYNTGQQAPGYLPAGNLRQLYSPAGQQYWFESILLPALPIGTDCIQDVFTLLCKKADYLQNQNPDQASQEQQFQYMAGFQRHTFVNSGNTTVFAEFWECHPREKLIGRTITAGDPTLDPPTPDIIQPASIGDLVLADYVTNQPDSNTYQPKYVSTSYDSVTDISVRISKNLGSTNAKYKITKPMRVSIQPGGTFVYTLRAEPFKFTNTEWNWMVGNSNSVTPYQNKADYATYVPGFTKQLVARFWAELSHNEQVDQLYSAVNCGPLSLMHTQVEYHHCRAVPNRKLHDTIIDYRLDESADATQHMDELNQDNENFDN